MAEYGPAPVEQKDRVEEARDNIVKGTIAIVGFSELMRAAATGF